MIKKAKEENLEHAEKEKKAKSVIKKEVINGGLSLFWGSGIRRLRNYGGGSTLFPRGATWWFKLEQGSLEQLCFQGCPGDREESQEGETRSSEPKEALGDG